MTEGHPFWFALVWACVAWYSTVTVYVSIKGVRDIRRMLTDLANTSSSSRQSE
ncbi:MAG: hypothetical protein KDA89_19670 [Planctomycetaceae bacterium]|nr:hypothetical protein [Planctomycetaceae bacterium]